MLPAIVPAAGMSTRLGRNKLLLPFKGQPLIAHAVDTLMASKVDEIIVVLGHEADQVRAAIGNRQRQIRGKSRLSARAQHFCPRRVCRSACSGDGHNDLSGGSTPSGSR